MKSVVQRLSDEKDSLDRADLPAYIEFCRERMVNGRVTHFANSSSQNYFRLVHYRKCDRSLNLQENNRFINPSLESRFRPSTHQLQALLGGAGTSARTGACVQEVDNSPLLQDDEVEQAFKQGADLTELWLT